MMTHECLYISVIGVDDTCFERAGITPDGELKKDAWDNKFVLLGTTEKVSLISTSTNSDRDYILNEVEMKMSVYLSDARIGFHCRNYDAGGGWIGFGGVGLIVAGVANSVSRKNAETKTAGTVLCGHIRYEWIAQLGFICKSSFLNDNTLYIVYYDSEQTKWEIQLLFAKDVNVEEMANAILKKSSQYKLNMNESRKFWDDTYPEIEEYAKCKRILRKENEGVTRFSSYLPAPLGESLRPSL